MCGLLGATRVERLETAGIIFSVFAGILVIFQIALSLGATLGRSFIRGQQPWGPTNPASSRERDLWIRDLPACHPFRSGRIRCGGYRAGGRKPDRTLVVASLCTVRARGIGQLRLTFKDRANLGAGRSHPLHLLRVSSCQRVAVNRDTRAAHNRHYVRSLATLNSARKCRYVRLVPVGQTVQCAGFP